MNFKLVYLILVCCIVVGCSGNNTQVIEEVEEISITSETEYLKSDKEIFYRPGDETVTNYTVEYNGKILTEEIDFIEYIEEDTPKQEEQEELNETERVIKKVTKKTVPVTVISIGERSLVPLLDLRDNIGFIVEWDGGGKRQEITVSKGEKKIRLTLGSNRFTVRDRVDGYIVSEEVYGTTPNIEFNGKLYVPTRFIAENFGLEVVWDYTNRVIKINNK